MLYIPKNIPTTVQIPRVSANDAEATSIRLYSTIDLTTTDIEVIVADVTGAYFTISLNIGDIDDGEYRYALMNGVKALSVGLAQVYSEVKNTIEYDEKEEYIQYE